MPRDMDSNFQGGLTAPVIRPVFFAELTFKSSTEYVWSGVGEYSWNGKTWTGAGDLGEIGTYSEGIDLSASGITVGLSGVNNAILGECLTDFQQGAPATVWLGLVDENINLIGTPVVWFGGLMDKAPVDIGTDTSKITLNLETEAIRLQQSQRLKYTSADQRRLYPGDSGFDYVEKLNDIALRWQ